MTGVPNSFIQEKVNELKSALFFPENSSVLKMPVHVVSEAEMDDDGFVWFVVQRPVAELSQFDQEFPAKLDFFKKGKNFYFKISGTASLLSAQTAGDQNIPENISRAIEDTRLIAVRVKVEQGDYFESIPKQASANWIQSGVTQFKNWLFNSAYDSKNPHLIAIPIKA
jgi:hypothetical protein